LGDERPGFLSRLPPTGVALIGVLGILAVCVIDYASGVEVRVVPLYYLPLSVVAWQMGRRPVVAAAALCALCWAAANYFAGQRFSSPFVWGFNVLMQGLSCAVVGVLIVALRAAVAHERTVSRTDALTSLLNARNFYEEAARVLALSRRKRHPVALAYLDLDNFKSVNDNLGHRAGDELLRAVAAIIQGSMRKSDVAARIGGDEFAVLLPETSPEEARLACERLRTLVAERFSRDAWPVTASVGGVAFLAVPDTVDAMVHLADTRMYAAKAAGRNRVDVEVVGPAAS
jgi:diguanylate cyclase (GGDEF)-like protein